MKTNHNKNFEKKYTWFEGAIPGYPTTDNALEGTNAVLKEEYTLRERLPLRDFVRMAMTIVRDWSQERNPVYGFYKEFFLKPDISTAIQTDAYALATSIEIWRRKILGETFFFIPSFASKRKPIKDEDINTFIRKSANFTFWSFDAYVQYIERMHVVQYNVEEW